MKVHWTKHFASTVQIEVVSLSFPLDVCQSEPNYLLKFVESLQTFVLVFPMIVVFVLNHPIHRMLPVTKHSKYKITMRNTIPNNY